MTLFGLVVRERDRHPSDDRVGTIRVHHHDDPDNPCARRVIKTGDGWWVTLTGPDHLFFVGAPRHGEGVRTWPIQQWTALAPILGHFDTDPPSRALARAHESISLLLEELEKASHRAASADETKHERDHWRDLAQQRGVRLAQVAQERDDALWELHVLKRSLAEIAGEST